MTTYIRIIASKFPYTNFHESQRIFLTWYKQHTKMDYVTDFRRYNVTVGAAVRLLGKNHVQPNRGYFGGVQFSNKVRVLLVLLTSATLTSRVGDILLVR
jgi:hypothetical protein